MSTSCSIKKILIANRGEIAVRIIRTCKEYGIETVAVYSEIDKNSLHARLADESIFIGPSPSQESYLNQDNIIKAAKRTKTTAIHPGYGFLSENASFAERCEKEGILWLGPSSSAILAMGSKIEAKKLLKGNKDIPLIPGTISAITSPEEVIKIANEIGFPVLLKASAGGGGKGMRVVRNSKDLPSALKSAQREALSSFGDSSMLLEKYFEDVKHIEVQIIGDKYGNVTHLFERECSVQRRHQKIIEEAPSSCLSDNIRNKLLFSATEIGKKISYQSLGTVEFIYEPKTEKYYFLEVNTRLQVEHPVTEMITNLDLVLLQIQIGEGKSLKELGIDNGNNNNNLKINGHSIECRLCAEDPNNQFFPCTGPIQLWKQINHPFIRYDTYIQSGSEISIFYDPMIAKIISWGETREQAIKRMEKALKETIFLGLPSNREFLLQILSNNKFRDTSFNTHLIEDDFSVNERNKVFNEKLKNNKNEIAIVAMIHEWNRIEHSRKLLRNLTSGWRNNRYIPQSKYFLFPDNELVHVQYDYKYNNNTHCFHVIIDNITYENVELLQESDNQLFISINGRQSSFTVCNDVNDLNILYLQSKDWGTIHLQKKNKLSLYDEDEEEEEGDIIAPMPSRVLEVHVTDGDKVKIGQPLLIVESMKMQNTYNATTEGIVKLFVKQDQLVEAGSIMISIIPEHDETENDKLKKK